MAKYGSTCGDACELRSRGLCGDVVTFQCDCGSKRCFSGWECVANACAELYTRDALDTQAEKPVREALAKVAARLTALDAMPIEEEPAGVTALRDWLEAEFQHVSFDLDAKEHPMFAPEAITSPRTLVIDLWMYGTNERVRWTPRSVAGFQSAFAAREKSGE
jgi:hypothetical protein